MIDVSPIVMQQLEEAQAAYRQSPTNGGAAAGAVADGPPIRPQKELTTAAASAAPAGTGTAQYVLLDHYFGSTARTLWAYASSAWHPHAVADVDEQGAAQVAFAASRVDAWWDNSNQLTVLRCWKKY